MKPSMAVALGAVVVGAWACGVSEVMANAIQTGTVVELAGASNFFKTADNLIRTYIVQILGGVIGIGGLAVVGKQPGVGITMVSGGTGMLFIPSIMGSGTQVVQASGILVASLPAWLRQGTALLSELGPLALGIAYLQRRRSLARAVA